MDKKVSGPVYLEIDDEHFVDTLGKLLQDYHDFVESGNDGSKTKLKVSKIFTALQLAAKHGFSKMVTIVDQAFVALCRLEDGAHNAMAASERIKQAKQSFSDQRTRCDVDIAQLRTKFMVVGVEKSLKAVCNVAEFEEFSKSLHCLQKVLDCAAKLCSFIAAMGSNPDKSNLIAVMDLLGELDSLNNSSGGNFIGHIDKLRGSGGVQKEGKEVYAAALTSFKKTCSELAALASAKEVDMPEDLAAQVESCRTSTFKLRQLAAWSDTPQFDRESIDLAEAMVLPICLHAAMLRKCAAAADPKAVAKELKHINAPVVTAMKCLDELDKQMPKLTWTFGSSSAAEEFFESLRRFSRATTPVYEGMAHAAVNKAINFLVSLTKLLSADDDSDEKFFSAHTPAKLTKVANKRSAARNAVAEAKEILNQCAMPLPVELTSREGEINRAKWQSVRYGLMVFLRHEDARANTEAGAAVRAQLKAVWDSHKDNEDLTMWLSSDLKDTINRTLASEGESMGSSTRKRFKTPGNVEAEAAGSAGATKARRKSSP